MPVSQILVFRHHSNLCLHLHIAFPLRLCLFISSYLCAHLPLCPNLPFLQGHSHIGLEPTLLISSELHQLQGPYLHVRSHAQVLGAQDFRSLWGNTIQPITDGKLKSEIRGKTKMKREDILVTDLHELNRDNQNVPCDNY